MRKVYTNKLRKKVCTLICDKHESTKLIACANDIPLKTVENWVTKYNKDRKCFDKKDDYYLYTSQLYKHRYDNLSRNKLIKELKLRDQRIHYLESMVKINDM